jgi:hypothetical protein
MRRVSAIRIFFLDFRKKKGLDHGLFFNHPHYSPTLKRITHTVVALVLGSMGVSAQSSGGFTITKIEPAIVSTPSISYSGATQKSARPKNWMEVEVAFSWLPSPAPVEKYADDIVLDYYVLLANKTAANPQGTLLTGQVTHCSVPAMQNDLKSVMYVSPRTLERFFDGKIPSSATSAVVDIGVTISRQGQVLAQKSLKSPGAWWPQYQKTSGFLLNKNETPFAPINADYYEAVKNVKP